MMNPDSTKRRPLVIYLFLKLIFDAFITFVAFLACFASIYLLGDQCFDNLEAGGRFVFNIGIYGTTLLIAGFALLMFSITLIAFFYEKPYFRESIHKSIYISLIFFGVIVVLFYLVFVFPAVQYCHVSPMGR